MAASFTRAGLDVALPYVAALASLDEAITPDHLRQDLDVIDFKMTLSRGGVWKVTVTVPNPGPALLSPEFPQYFAFLESTDGTLTPETARTLARARLVPVMRSNVDIAGRTVRLELVCAPIDVKNAVFQYANANLTKAPFFDTLFDAVDLVTPEKSLDAYPANLHVDPVSHEVSLVDWIDSDTTIDLDDMTVATSHKLSLARPPAARAKCTVEIEWSQRALTPVDISTRVNGTGAVTTCNASHLEQTGKGISDSYMTTTAGSGWKRDANLISSRQTLSYYMPTGNRYQYVYQNQTYRAVYHVNDQGQQEIDHYELVDPTHYPVDHAEMGQLPILSYSYDYLWYICDYKQQRREILTVYMDYPLQGVMGVDTVADLGNLKLKDPTIWYVDNPVPPPEPDPNGSYQFPYSPVIEVKPWDINTIYNKGDKVLVGMQAFECLNDLTTGYIYTFKGITVLHTNWKVIDNGAPIGDVRYPSWFDRAVGQASIEHAMLRLRAALRGRSIAVDASFTADWESAIAITADTKVRVTMYNWKTGLGFPVIGKPKSITRRIDKSGKWIDVVLGVPVGTGEDTHLPVISPDPSTFGSMSAGQYFTQTTKGIDVSTPAGQRLYKGIYDFTVHYQEDKLGTYTLGDIVWTYGAQPLILPVDAFQLGSPNYAVFDVTRENESDEQVAAANFAGLSGRNPCGVVDGMPTRVDVTMRNIATAGVLERRYDVAAEIHTSPRGIDLLAAGELS